MVKFILFLKKIHFVLLFLVLEIVALRYYADSTSYTKAKIVTASNYLVGGIHERISNLGNYFALKRDNETLLAQLAQLQNELDGYRHYRTADSLALLTDSLYAGSGNERMYEYTTARVVNNTLTHQENYITIDKGAEGGVEPNMALVSNGGILGYVLGCSDRYAVCMSILNRSFKTSGKLKGNDYFGSIFWDGASYEYVTLSEIPKYAQIQVGDTVVTTDYSSIFPPDLMIGTVENFELFNAVYYNVKVKLQGNIASANQILLVKSLDAGERNALEQIVQQPEAY